ncbi:MAG: hypothetical protein U5K72_07500 [Balneolaceae bacterium]|nr:hypothetical protein [Balneolaceae bacterium]
METIKITVRDKKHAQMLADLARELNFVTSVESLKDDSESVIPKGNFSSDEEFLSLCGLWKDRDVTIEKIREQAWRKINL